MRSVRWLVALCLALSTAVALANTAGQVMFAYGETHALRAGRIIQLHAGSEVESGDQLHTGVESYLQIRFTDWSVMSLRPHTDFVIEQYVYEAHAGGMERAFFSLLNGGVRSLTGLIGHRNRGHYLLRTRMSSIGVRGTEYSVLICDQDCRLDNGSLGEDGVYGGVIEGRIAVSPYGSAQLEREFGAGEYFRLLSANSAPERFFAPPPFFWDPREPQARAPGRTFAGIAWKPSPAPSEVSGPVATAETGIAGSLLRTNGSLVLSPITAPVLNQVSPVPGQTGSQLGTTVGALSTPLAPAVDATMSALAPVAMPVTTMLGSTVGSIANPVVAPVVGAVNPVVAPVVAPIAPVVAPVVAPVTPVVIPVVAPIAPVVAPVAPVVTPVVAPAPVVVTPPPPTVALPTVPSLPVVGGAVGGLLPRR